MKVDNLSNNFLQTESSLFLKFINVIWSNLLASLIEFSS